MYYSVDYDIFSYFSANVKLWLHWVERFRCACGGGVGVGIIQDNVCHPK